MVCIPTWREESWVGCGGPGHGCLLTVFLPEFPLLRGLRPQNLSFREIVPTLQFYERSPSSGLRKEAWVSSFPSTWEPPVFRSNSSYRQPLTNLAPQPILSPSARTLHTCRAQVMSPNDRSLTSSLNSVSLSASLLL